MSAIAEKGGGDRRRYCVQKSGFSRNDSVRASRFSLGLKGADYKGCSILDRRQTFLSAINDRSYSERCGLRTGFREQRRADDVADACLSARMSPNNAPEVVRCE
jgi:hypothetical protein